MAHFARLDNNNKVLRVSVVADRIILDANGEESEELGIKHLKKIHGEDTIWKQTSRNGNFRYTFASLNGHYIPEHDIFMVEKPYPSWILSDINNDVSNPLYFWRPPIEKPESLPDESWEGYYEYQWDEVLYQNDTSDPKTEGWAIEPIRGIEIPEGLGPQNPEEE
jgi:hypothetical protein